MDEKKYEELFEFCIKNELSYEEFLKGKELLNLRDEDDKKD